MFWQISTIKPPQIDVLSFAFAGNFLGNEKVQGLYSESFKEILKDCIFMFGILKRFID